MVEIKKTNDYTLFKLIEVNRPVIAPHVKELQRKIAANDKTHLNPIIVNTNMEIIDGQHRFNALRNLGKPIHYVIDDNFKDEDLIEFNLGQKNWDNYNFLDYYLKKEHLYYKEFKEFKEKFNLKWSASFTLFIDSPNPNATFKSGNIERIRNLKRAYAVAEIINQWENVFKIINEAVLGSICYLYDHHQSDVKIDRLYEKLREYSGGEIIYPKTNMKEQLRFLDDIYNSRKRKKVPFSVQYELSKINSSKKNG